jgi:hypothetical protein
MGLSPDKHCDLKVGNLRSGDAGHTARWSSLNVPRLRDYTVK